MYKWEHQYIGYQERIKSWFLNQFIHSRISPFGNVNLKKNINFKKFILVVSANYVVFSFIKVCMAFVFGLQTIGLKDFTK